MADAQACSRPELAGGAGSMARNMEDLILLDSIVRAVNSSTRGNGALPAPGVSCEAPVDRDFDLSGITLGLPVSYWADIDPAVPLIASS